MLQSLLVSGYDDLQKRQDNTGHSHIYSLNIFREAAAIQRFKSMNSGVRLWVHTHIFQLPAECHEAISLNSSSPGFIFLK